MDFSEQHLSARSRVLTASAIREIGKIASRPDVISFAGGAPSPATFPMEKMRAAFDSVLSREGKAALQYGPTDGYPPLRAWIADTLSGDGARILPEQILMISGSQQGIDLLGKLLVDEGDAVYVETPTYIGALQGLCLYRPRFRPVPTDDEGLIPESLPDVVQGKQGQARASLLYTIPTFQNPTGRTLPYARRVGLVEQAARLKLPVIEDDPYLALDYAGERHRTMLTLNPGGVIYLGSFSKVLAPGIRLGYVVAPLPLAKKLEQAKQAADLHTAMLTQMVVYEILKEGFLDRHLPEIRKLYRSHCEVMLAGLEDHFPAPASWTKPAGGMFIWATLPAGMDAMKILEKAIAENVAFVPGAPFYAEASQANTMRLSFVALTPEKIRTGIERLGKIIALK